MCFIQPLETCSGIHFMILGLVLTLMVIRISQITYSNSLMVFKLFTIHKPSLYNIVYYCFTLVWRIWWIEIQPNEDQNNSYNTWSSTWKSVTQQTVNKNNQRKVKQALGLKYKPFIFLNYTFEESKITSGRKVNN